MLKILMAASEGVPFAKTGGLADVIGALPKALFDKGIDVRVVLPLYQSIPHSYKCNFKFLKWMTVPVGWRNQYLGIFEYKLDGIIYYFVDNEYYFKRENLYGYYDDAERFGYFCKAVLALLPEIGFQPNILHCHDWQTGMIPVLLEAKYRYNDFYKGIRTLFTIHNIKFQGIFPASLLQEFFDLGSEYCTEDKLEFYGNINFLKGGLVYSNLLNTVSPTYAHEVQDPFYGEKLEGVLRERANEFVGVLNGIDTEEYNPAKDPCIAYAYDCNHLEGKRQNKRVLQESLGLEVSDSIPVISMISRLTDQKGLDLIACVIHEIMNYGVELIVLGTGEQRYETMFYQLSEQYRGRISANIKFDNHLAHRIYAGSDIFLMPSLFEPCGLGQLIALRYGTIPIVRETGGLVDTVKSYNEYTAEGNGFSFRNYNAHDMLYTIGRAVCFYHNKEIWHSLIKRAMSCDYSWEASAKEYLKLYESII